MTTHGPLHVQWLGAITPTGDEVFPAYSDPLHWNDFIYPLYLMRVLSGDKSTSRPFLLAKIPQLRPLTAAPSTLIGKLCHYLYGAT
jgi:hypothetical protein